MNKPKAGKSVERPPTRPVVDRAFAEAPPKRKPTGPVIYRIEKGADVWPVRK